MAQMKRMLMDFIDECRRNASLPDTEVVNLDYVIARLEHCLNTDTKKEFGKLKDIVAWTYNGNVYCHAHCPNTCGLPDSPQPVFRSQTNDTEQVCWVCVMQSGGGNV